MKNKKKVFIVISIVSIIFVVLLLNIDNISKLSGSASRKVSDRYSETITEICNGITDNEYFMTISFGLYQNYGPEGNAEVILTSVDKNGFQFKKEINTSVSNRANFSYAVPKGQYKLTILKDGFEEYNHDHVINEDTGYFTVDIVHLSAKDIIISGHAYLDYYYDYIRNSDKETASIRLYKKGNAEVDLYTEEGNYFLLAKVVKDMLRKHNVAFEYGDTVWDKIGALLLDMLFAMIITDSRIINTQGLSYRYTIKAQFEAYKSGQCEFNQCFDIDENFLQTFGSEQNFIDVFDLILDDKKMPINNGIIIDEGVQFIPSYIFMGAKTDTLTIPNSVVIMNDAALAATDIETLIFSGTKTDLDYGSESLLETAFVDKIKFNEGIESIPDNLFSDIGNTVSLDFPMSLKRIGNSSFENTKITNGKLYLNNVEIIGDQAFQYSDIESIYFGNKLKEIGNYAFNKNNIKKTIFKNHRDQNIENYVLLPKTINKIGNYAFSDNKITELKFEVDNKNNLSDIEYIGKEAFKNNDISEIIMPTNELNNIVIDDYAFSNNKIVFVDLGNSVDIINKSSFEKNLIKNVNFSNGLKIIGERAFANNEIGLLELNNSIEEIGNSAFENNKIANLKLSDALKKIGTKAFYNNLITELKVNKNVEIISNNAFENNKIKKLEFIVDDDTNKCSLKSIGFQAFYGNNEKTSNVIEELYLPKSESEYEIFGYSFSNNKIKKLTLSESVILGSADNAFKNNNIQLVKVLGENKNRYNSKWKFAGLPEELQIY